MCVVYHVTKKETADNRFRTGAGVNCVSDINTVMELETLCSMRRNDFANSKYNP